VILQNMFQVSLTFIPPQAAHFLVSFVAAMVTNPHIQARAQQELDSVLGPAALPSISDKERLPYIRNLIDETFRLYPVAPLGMFQSNRHRQDAFTSCVFCFACTIAMPHSSFQDDVYQGYEIQKGTAV